MDRNHQTEIEKEKKSRRKIRREYLRSVGYHQWSNLHVTGVLEGGENRAKDTYEELEIKLPTSIGSLKKQESSRKTSISALLNTPKPLIVWITINCGKF